MQSVVEKAKAIRLLVLDVDGILTSGIVYFDGQGNEIKGFNFHDGLGIKLLQKVNIQVALISGKNSPCVMERILELGIQYYYLGHEEKLGAYEELKQKLALSDEEIAYMGDDLPDLPLLRRAGLRLTVPQAPEIIQQYADFITKKEGGHGAVREVCELILEAQSKYQSVIQSYLNK